MPAGELGTLQQELDAEDAKAKVHCWANAGCADRVEEMLLSLSQAKPSRVSLRSASAEQDAVSLA